MFFDISCKSNKNFKQNKILTKNEKVRVIYENNWYIYIYIIKKSYKLNIGTLYWEYYKLYYA